jgi:hypothetical protein
VSQRSLMLSMLAVLTFGAVARAEPRDTVWLEDVHIEPPESTDTGFVFDYQAADFKALEQGMRWLTLRFSAGVAERIEVVPLFRLRQRDSEPLELREIGAEVRSRLLGDAEAPHVLGYGGYRNDLGTERDHHLNAGGAGRYELIQRLFVAGDLRIAAGLGGELDAAWEARVGAGIGYALFPRRELTVGLETFAHVPLAGTRLSDPAFGEAGESTSFYYGPSVSARLGPLWTSASIASGYFVSEPASNLLLRWMVGLGGSEPSRHRAFHE